MEGQFSGSSRVTSSFQFPSAAHPQICQISSYTRNSVPLNSLEIALFSGRYVAGKSKTSVMFQSFQVTVLFLPIAKTFYYY